MSARAQAAQEQVAQMESRRAGEKERRERAQYELHQQEIAVARDTERLKGGPADYDAHAMRLDTMRAAIDQLDESLRQIARELERIEEQGAQEEGDTDEMNARTETLSAALDKARREREGRAGGPHRCHAHPAERRA